MESLIVYLLAGVVAGLLGGLFGLGGGAIVVPVLIYSFTFSKFDDAFLTHLAIGTSLACIVVTSLVSIYTHQRRSAVRWRLALALMPAIGLGVVAGGVFATSVSGVILQLLFGLFLMAVAVQMGFGGHPKSHREIPGPVGASGAGAGIGFLSGIFGIGGGSLSVPFLIYCNVPITHAIATSATLGFPIALLGATTYAFRGWGVADLPEGAVGFVFLPALVGIVITSIPFARIGATLAHRLPAENLKRSFAGVLAVLGLVFVIDNINVGG